jgi:uncharacterized protein
MRFLAIAGLLLALLPGPAAAQSDADAAAAAAAAARRAQELRSTAPMPAPPTAPLQPQQAMSSGGLPGRWIGTWVKSEDPLPVAVTFEITANGYSGSFDSDALQVAGIPFNDVRVNARQVHFVVAGDATPAVFDGTIAGDALDGEFVEGAVHGRFHLERSTAPAPAILARDVTFKNGAVTLSGTLLLPRTGGWHRAILFLHGAGAEGRWANRYLAQKFAERGVAALVYDKRGVGQSTGDWKTSYFWDLAGDAAAGIRFLQAQPGVDATHVGIYGHGEGATIAPLVAERASDLRFLIASAAAGLAPAAIERYSLGNSMGLWRLPPGERADAEAYLDELVDVAYHGKARTTLEAMRARFKGRSWYFTPPPADSSYWTVSRNAGRYDPLSHWENVHASVFLVYGEHDERVPAEASLAAILAALKRGDHGQHILRTWMIQNADHTFTIVGRPVFGGWPTHVPDYADRLVNWVLWDS